MEPAEHKNDLSKRLKKDLLRLKNTEGPMQQVPKRLASVAICVVGSSISNQMLCFILQSSHQIPMLWAISIFCASIVPPAYRENGASL